MSNDLGPYGSIPGAHALAEDTTRLPVIQIRRRGLGWPRTWAEAFYAAGTAVCVCLLAILLPLLGYGLIYLVRYG
jgi:hypothetical protein